MLRLNPKKLETRELSIDDIGTLYFHENRVFRAINDSHIHLVKELFQRGFLKEIVEAGYFPKTWVSDVEIEGYSLVVEHELIPNWNYSYEWSFTMLQDAALLVLDLNIIAQKYGFQMMDGHALNVVFRENKPCYVDLGSFIFASDNNTWVGYSIIQKSFYVPLVLWSKNMQKTAVNILLMREYFPRHEYIKIVHPILSLFNFNWIQKLQSNLERLVAASENQIQAKLEINNAVLNMLLFIKKIFFQKFSAQRLRRKVKRLKAPKKKTLWTEYHNNTKPMHDYRFQRLTEMINKLTNASTLIEIATNQGRFSKHLIENTNIKSIIASDYDETAIDILYKNKPNKILPLVYDIVRPMTRKPDSYFYSRMKSDICLALAISHHLLLSQNISIDYLFQSLQKLSNKYVIVEFMPMGLFSGDITKIPPVPDYYTTDWFKIKFKEYFTLITDELLEKNRHVFVGRLKD